MIARPASRRASGRAGFVLVMTLLLLGLISAGAIAILIEAKAGAAGVAGLAEAARARNVAQAGAARAVYGSMVAEDPLEAFSATESHPAIWRFDGLEVALSAVAESDRIDLNAGRPELVEAAVAGLTFDETLRAEVLEAFRDARARDARLPGAATLLRPCLRSGPERRRLETVFTVVTRSAGVAPRSGADESLDLIPSLTAADRDVIDHAIAIGRSPSDDRRLGHVRAYLSDRSPHHRIVARVSAGTVAIEREATISLVIIWPYAHLIGARWRRLVASIGCG